MKPDDLIGKEPHHLHDIVLVEDLPSADPNESTPKPPQSHAVLTDGKRVPADFTAREFASRYGWVYLRADRLALNPRKPYGLAPPSPRQKGRDAKAWRSLLVWTDYSARMHVKPLLTRLPAAYATLGYQPCRVDERQIARFLELGYPRVRWENG